MEKQEIVSTEKIQSITRSKIFKRITKHNGNEDRFIIDIVFPQVNLFYNESTSKKEIPAVDLKHLTYV